MAKRANPGELRTRIEIHDYHSVLDQDGYEIGQWINVFGEGGLVHCKWVNAHGTEVLTAKQLGLRELATLTMRYTPKLTSRCRIFRIGDPAPYEVISIDNVENRNEWLEVKVQRKEASSA